MQSAVLIAADFETVPNGGYVTAVFHRTCTTHFAQTHPSQHNRKPWPISMQLCFLRKTNTGPATLTVQDVKLGKRTSTLHITLLQENTARAVAYVTVSDLVADVGISVPSSWKVYPPAPTPSAPEVERLGYGPNHESNPWKKHNLQHPDFRRAGRQTETYYPQATHLPGVKDQWSRLRPVGPKGGEGRWTDESLAYLVDIFPATLETLEVAGNEQLKKDVKEEDPEKRTPVPFWFPTVSLTVDFKRSLPEEGIEWLYSRVTSKQVKNGRSDIEVVVLDEAGEVVAIAQQVGLVMDAGRNVGQKSKM